MSFARYPSYKDSGVEWLGEVPGHWEVSSFRHCLSHMFNGLTATQVEESVNTVPVTRIETISYGVVDELKLGFINSNEARVDRLLLPGDILFSNINSLNMVGKCAFYLGGRKIYAGMNLLVLRPAAAKCLPLWLCWLVRSASFRCVVESLAKPAINQASVSQSSINSITVIVPPLPEQTQIAAFLDRETAKIDGLVAEQRRLMALLKEKRQAVISHAVTQGLNPLAPMKPSGIEWLGDVPEHWEVCSIRRIVTTIEQGWSPECFSRPAENEEWGVLKAGCVNRGLYDQNDNKALPAELAPMPEYEVQIGDVLMSRASGSPELVGSTALVTSTRAKLMLSDKIFRLRFDQRMEPKFFVAALNSRPLRSQIEQALSGGNGLANNLPQASLRGFFLALPPMQEQQDVCNYIESELTKFDTLTLEAQHAIDLLAERRTALISAAVTGQIDVRGAF